MRRALPVPALARATAALGRARRRTRADMVARSNLLLGALGAEPKPGTRSLPTLCGSLLTALDGAGADRVWLTLAVLSGSLPTSEEVVAARRRAQLEGPAEILVAAAERTTRRTARREVRLATDQTLVDLGDMITSTLTTGIQRVARSVATEWDARHPITVVGWTADLDALRQVDVAERAAALSGDRSGGTQHRPASPEVVLVPWRSTYLLPELAIQPTRCTALQSLAAHSGNRTGVIGFDLVPITSSETSAGGFAGVFALNLAAVAHFDVVGAISVAAATEYEGWRRMLEGAGLAGPTIAAVTLPGHAPPADAASLRSAAARFALPGMPLVLVVGSHEPRKNHLAVLQAAEILWRRGHRFGLTFVGGNAWASEEFTERLQSLRGAGRPVESVSKLPDRLLWAAYRVARCTVFPSVNEGFGLPVAESLSAGTPVLTSDFGSMREIAEGGGALLVDPRDDEAITSALERLLVDDLLVARLADEARARPQQTWADYAERLWTVFHP